MVAFPFFAVMVSPVGFVAFEPRYTKEMAAYTAKKHAEDNEDDEDDED